MKKTVKWWTPLADFQNIVYILFMATMGVAGGVALTLTLSGAFSLITSSDSLPKIRPAWWITAMILGGLTVGTSMYFKMFHDLKRASLEGTHGNS